MIRLVKILIILFLAVFLSILIIKFKFISASFIWILALGFLIFLLASIFVTRTFIKVILFNIALIILILGIFEFYFWKVETNKLTYHSTATSLDRIVGRKWDTTPDDILGYVLVKNSKRTVTRYVNDKIIYSVTYTIGENGLRISPNTNKADAPAILFFGDSFTYGESVNDDETMPYVTGILTGREYAIYNFGVHGYGPQHMLAKIDHGLVDSIITHKPEFAIYLALPDHINRLMGLVPWLIKGPQYVLDGNGEIISSSVSIPLCARTKSQLITLPYLYRTSNRIILRRNENTSKNKANWKENDGIKTFVAVVDKTRNLLTSKYPGIEFYVIFWDLYEKDKGFSKAVIEGLTKKAVKTYKVSNIIKDDYNYGNKNPYFIPYDGHPTPLTHRIIANYIVKEIIKKKIK